MKAPAVSVVVPTYNRGRFLPDAIRSVQAQTLADWELIIVDDGSTDETRDVLAPFLAADSRLSFVSNAGASGPGGARNTGIRAAKADAIAFLDSDDRWFPAKLACFRDALSSDAILVASDYVILGDEPDPGTMKSFLLGTMAPWWERYPAAAAIIPCTGIRDDIQRITAPDLMLSMTIAGFLWIHTSSVMVRREPLMRAGLFDERLQRTEDIDLWLKLSKLGRFIYLDEVLATYDATGREGAASDRYGSQAPDRRHSAYSESHHHLDLLRRIGRDYPLSTAQQTLLRLRLTEHHRRCARAAWQDRRMAGLAHIPPLLVAGAVAHVRRAMARLGS